jgi:hypothetical protein|nr:MAG TPA: hypothetical protein [Caudoviricetes sp.]
MRTTSEVWIDTPDVFRFTWASRVNLRKWFLLKYKKSARIQAFIRSAFEEVGAEPVIDFLSGFAIDSIVNGDVEARKTVATALYAITDTLIKDGKAISDVDVDMIQQEDSILNFDSDYQNMFLVAKSCAINSGGRESCLKISDSENNIVILSGSEQEAGISAGNLIISLGDKNTIKCNDCTVIVLGSDNTVSGGGNTVIAFGLRANIIINNGSEVFSASKHASINTIGGKSVIYLTEPASFLRDFELLNGLLLDKDGKAIQLGVTYRFEHNGGRIVEI